MQHYTVHFIRKPLYMLRVAPPPIIRRANNCIYSIRYLSHRYCYLPLSWKSWNWFWVCCGWRIYIYIYIYIYICSYYSLWEWKNFTWLALLSSGLIPLNTVLFVKVTVAWIFAKSPTLFLGAESITFPCSQGSATGPNYESDETTPHHYVGHLHSTLSLFSTYIKVVHAINSLGGFWLKLFSQSRSSHSCYVTSPCWFVYCNNTYFFFCCGAATQRGTWPPHSWGF